MDAVCVFLYIVILTLAFIENVDYIEPDLALTKDNQIICMHELELSHATDVDERPEFESRKKEIALDNGLQFTGWFADSFTLEEIKTLRVKQRLRTRDLYYDGLFQIPTLEEAIDLLQDLNTKLKTNVGLYIEPKHPTYFRKAGLTYDEELVRVLTSKGYTIKGPEAKETKIIVECFESTQLKSLKEVMDLPLVQLVDRPLLKSADTLVENGHMLTKEGIKNISEYADAIGPLKRYLYPFDTTFMKDVEQIKGVLTAEELIKEIHKYKLPAHPWTTRNKWEDTLVDKHFKGDEMEEYTYLYKLGVDGIFTESAEAAMCAKVRYIESLESEEKKSIVALVLVPILVGLVFFLAGILIGRTFLSKHYDASTAAKERAPLVM